MLFLRSDLRGGCFSVMVGTAAFKQTESDHFVFLFSYIDPFFSPSKITQLSLRIDEQIQHVCYDTHTRTFYFYR